MKVQHEIEWFSNAWQIRGRNNSLAFQSSQNFCLFDFSGQDLNHQVVIDVRHCFVAGGTFEEKLKCLFEGVSLAAWRLAGVELVAFLVFKPCFQFFKNTSLLV